MLGHTPIIIPFHPNVASDLTPYTGYDVHAGSANDVLGGFYIPFKCEIRRCGFYITETFAGDTTAPILYFDEATCGDVPTEDGDVAIFTIPDATAAGTVVYNKNVTRATPARVTLEPGKWVVVSLQTDIADNGTEAGMLMPFLIVEMVPENDTNQSALTEIEA